MTEYDAVEAAAQAAARAAAEQAEREAWNEGVHVLNKINNAWEQMGKEPIKVNMDSAPQSVKEEAKRRREAKEAARINEKTRAAELETARLQGKIEALQERK